MLLAETLLSRIYGSLTRGLSSSGYVGISKKIFFLILSFILYPGSIVECSGKAAVRSPDFP